MNVELDRVYGVGTTFLHVAVAKNNIDFVKHLIANGHDANAKNSSGETALILALKSNRIEAVKILLDADADVRIVDEATGKTALGILISKTEEFIEEVMPHILANLERSKLEVETLVELFVAENWPIKYILPIKNVRLMQQFLERKPRSIHESDMWFTIDRCYCKNIELILRHGGESVRLGFYRNVGWMMINDYPKPREIDSVKSFVKYLSAWDYFDNDGEILRILDCIFENANLEYLKILLDLKIHAQVKEKFGIDLRVVMFGNRNAVETIREQRDFHVNSRGTLDNTALHYATKNRLFGNMMFLLDSGIDINSTNEHGQTALFHCVTHLFRNNCAEMLLVHGADVLVVDNDGLTVFELSEFQNSTIKKYFIARLAISRVEANVEIKQAIQTIINSSVDNKQFYEESCKKLEALKTCMISESISLFDFLGGKIEILSRLMHSDDTRSFISQQTNKRKLHKIIQSTIVKNLTVASNLYSCKREIAELISKSTRQIIDSENLVIEQITKYLNRYDIEQFNKYIALKG